MDTPEDSPPSPIANRQSPINPAPLVPFVKLADPASYVSCNWDLVEDAPGREHWVGFFKRHLETILKLGIDSAVRRGDDEEGAVVRAGRLRHEFRAFFDDFSHRPHAFAEEHGRVTILTLDAWRDQFLRKHGFFDPFIDLKDRENAKAVVLLPAVCRQADTIRGEDRQLLALMQGVFAGNIFDMGAETTAAAFLDASPDFFATRAQLPPRPWLIDDYNVFAKRVLGGPPHRKAVFFIDNAGSDFMLGALPLIRWMARRGTRIVLAANERPTLNDMTIYDVNAWWPKVIQAEPSFAALPIERVSTGTGEPLIDLANVSEELNTACHGADLVVLEGMGRGVESNLDAAFNCEALNVAMLKDTAVAQRCHGKLFDVVCRYR